MSLKPQPPRPMPAEMAVLGAKLLAADSPYRLVGDQLYEQYHEADYADLYPAEGQPALSPVDLALVTAFQSMEDLPDRQAAESVRLRLDWKYALHQPVDYGGFHYSVLSEFRDRVIQHGAEARVFEAVLGQLQALGLLKRRGRQRTDSAAVLTKVRHLNRLELVVETLRLAVRALLTADPTWTRATVLPTWEDRYGTRCVAERLSDPERAVLQSAVGPAGQWLLDRLAEPTTPPALAALPEVQTLRTVWAQQYEVREREVVFRDPGPYDGTTRLQSPHDPEARYSEKRGRGWVGDKVQVTETDDEDLPHLITDIALTSSVESDQAALGAIQERQAARDVAPGVRVADQGYVSGQTLADSAQLGGDLIGPAPADHSPQSRLPEGLTQDQFTVDLAPGTVVCPAGQTAARGRQRPDGSWQFHFATTTCAACPLRARCCTGRGGRTITLGPHHAQLQAARARQQTAEFQACYQQHRGGVEGCLSVLLRSHGLRVNRYIGRTKNHLRALFVAVGVNVRRAARWLAGGRPQTRRSGWGLVK
ncbi:MAG: IS1182 family transposase [Chloroflexi bacterium]|nr:IS1182 family transposase [Chloroflexota bacterium]